MKYILSTILSFSLSLLLQMQTVLAQEVENNSVIIQEVSSQELPKRNYSELDLITVEFAPGGEAEKHTHKVGVFVYVLEGVIENQLKGQELKTFKQGDVWWEPPGTVHLISRNISKTKRAKLLVFQLDEEDTPNPPE